mmetsp:Transcript_8565/g.20353  ORF Transcript_8565/g.20353 Transcript_8565/m.20353 type:complete len:193 (-) Transcript_8565:79-657(-)
MRPPSHPSCAGDLQRAIPDSAGGKTGEGGAAWAPAETGLHEALAVFGLPKDPRSLVECAQSSRRPVLMPPPPDLLQASAEDCHAMVKAPSSTSSSQDGKLKSPSSQGSLEDKVPAKLCFTAEEKLQLHKRGICHPCVAFALKPGGCWKGDNCSHCHHCSASQAEKRRTQLQAEARRKRRLNARQLASRRFWI